MGVLVGVSQPAGVRHGLGQEDPHLLRQGGKERRVEEAGGDGVDSDPLGAEVPSQGKRHANNGALKIN